MRTRDDRRNALNRAKKEARIAAALTESRTDTAPDRRSGNHAQHVPMLDVHTQRAAAAAQDGG